MRMSVYVWERVCVSKRDRESMGRQTDSRWQKNNDGQTIIDSDRETGHLKTEREGERDTEREKERERERERDTDIQIEIDTYAERERDRR